MAAVGVLVVGIGAAIVVSGFAVGGDLPISHMANDDRAGPIVGASLVIAAVLFIVFCFDVRRRYPVDRAFVPVMVTAMAGQFVAGVVPIGAMGQSNPIHVVAGLILGELIPVFLGLFAAAQPAGAWRRTAMGLFGAQALATVVGILLSQRGIAAVAELVPALVFHLWVGVVTMHAGRAINSFGPPAVGGKPRRS